MEMTLCFGMEYPLDMEIQSRTNENTNGV